MDNNLIFMEAQKESEEKSLSPYEQFQLSRYGNILNNADPDEEETDKVLFPRFDEIIFSLENPKLCKVK